MWVKLDILLESSCEMFDRTQHAWRSKRTRSVKRETQALKRWRHKPYKTTVLSCKINNVLGSVIWVSFALLALPW